MDERRGETTDRPAGIDAAHDPDDVWYTVKSYLRGPGRNLLEASGGAATFAEALGDTPPSERRKRQPPQRAFDDRWQETTSLRGLMQVFLMETGGARRPRSTTNLRTYIDGFIDWVEQTLNVRDPSLRYLSYQVVQLYVFWLQRPMSDRVRATHPRKVGAKPAKTTYAAPVRYSESSVESILKALRHFEGWLWKDGDDERRIDKRTLHRVLYVTPAEEGRRPLDDDQRERVITAAGFGSLGGTWQSIVKVMLGTGLRAEEVTMMMLSSVVPSDGVIQLQARMVKGKKRPRRVTLWPDVERVIREYVRNYRKGTQGPSDPLFTTREGKQFHVSGIQRIFRSLKASTEIDDLCAHQMRTTFAVNYLRAGCGNLLQLAGELGHSTKTGLRMTSRYALIQPLGDEAIGKTPLSVRSRRAGPPVYSKDFEVVERHRRASRNKA